MAQACRAAGNLSVRSWLEPSQSDGLRVAVGFSPRLAENRNSYGVAERRLKPVRHVFAGRCATRGVGLHWNRGLKPTATIRAPLRGALMRRRAATWALLAQVSDRSRRRKAAERIIPPTHVGGYRCRLPAGSASK